LQPETLYEKNIAGTLVGARTFLFAEQKKEKQAEEKANAELVSNLKSHVQYLADDKLEGRLTGSKGEELAMQYIVAPVYKWA
jgi:hypothetical protein